MAQCSGSMRPQSAAVETVVKKGCSLTWGRVCFMSKERWRRVRAEASGPCCTAFTLPAHGIPTAPVSTCKPSPQVPGATAS